MAEYDRRQIQTFSGLPKAAVRIMLQWRSPSTSSMYGTLISGAGAQSEGFLVGLIVLWLLCSIPPESAGQNGRISVPCMIFSWPGRGGSHLLWVNFADPGVKATYFPR